MTIAFIILGSCYFLFILALLIAWDNNSAYQLEAIEGSEKISVVISARNESKNIPSLLESLRKQTLSKDCFEVIIVNDQSNDDTVEMINKYNDLPNLTLIDMPSDMKSHKKAALSRGIAHAKYEIIVCTDADCVPQEGWLNAILARFEVSQLDALCGPVFYNGKSFWSRLMQIEFSAYIGTAAATLNMKLPTMANGANLAFRKSRYLEVGGYEGHADIPSGDDEFLVHDIHSVGGKVEFNRDQSAIVWTEAPLGLSAFFSQRIRWASKWGKYKLKGVNLLGALVWLMHLAFVLSIVPLFLYPAYYSVIAAAWALRLIINFIFLGKVLGFAGVRIAALEFFVLELVYSPYVVIFGVLGRFLNYTWKGR